MKKFIKDWWPLLLVAVIVIWKKREEKEKFTPDGLTPKGTDYGTSTHKTVYEWYYDENGKYHLNTYFYNPDGNYSELKAEGDEVTSRIDGRPDHLVKRWCNPPREFPYYLLPSREVNNMLY